MNDELTRLMPPVTILLVDDVDEKRYVAAHALKRAGYVTREADSGALALELVSEEVDAVVLDVRMPGMDGLEVARRLRGNPKTANIPILMLTSTYKDTAQKVTGLQIADAYLVEPIEPAEFVATVEAAVRKRRTDAVLSDRKRMESIGRLAGGVAHDFNNLLTVVVGFSESSLELVEPGSELAANLQDILRAGEECARLTRQLLAFSRKQLAWPVEMDLNNAIQSLVPALRHMAGPRVEVVLDLDREAGAIVADPAQVEQVLVTMALNARDAMEGGGRLTIGTAPANLTPVQLAGKLDVRAGAYLRLRVQDTGRGMDAATRTRVFEPFFTTKGMGRGTGLGLAAVDGIVKQNNGFIEVDSEPGKGARFDIYLPTRIPAPLVASKPPPSKSDASAPPTVLVVEDESMLRSFARSVLVAKGFHVLTATDGLEGLETARANAGSIDLVLTDIMMPRMNGLQLAAELADVAPGLPVALMSGLPSSGEALPREKLTGRPLLLKPFTHRQLVEFVGGLTRRGASA